MKRKEIFLTISIFSVWCVSVVSAHKPYVALTFDDGPDPRTTEKILDILDANHIHGTFFLIGEHVASYPAIAKHIVASWNAIGNHTWDHTTLTSLSPSEVRQQIQKTQSMIKKTVGFAPVMFRPPYGYENKMVIKTAWLASVQWSIDSEDRKWPSENELIQHIVDSLQPGAIVLLHDGMLQTVPHLQALIDAIRAKWYTFATVPMLFGGSKKLLPLHVYHHW